MNGTKEIEGAIWDYKEVFDTDDIKLLNFDNLLKNNRKRNERAVKGRIFFRF